MDRERKIIDNFFLPLAQNKESLKLMNDAAFFKNENLVISTDMMVEGQHFTLDYSPKIIAKKLIRINLSDLAAMGAIPYGFFLNIALPKKKLGKWLTNFVAGLKSDIKEFNLKLFGGDLSNSSKIFLNATIIGKVDGIIHKDNSAKVGSEIFVSGYLGDAGLGLKLIKKAPTSCSEKTKKKLIKKLHLPEPQLGLGNKLLNTANFCTDLSDGLIRELALIADQSNVQANIFLEKIPISNFAKEIKKIQKKEEFWETILSGGEDYELLFSVNKRKKKDLKEKKINNISNIGFFSKGKGVKIFDKNGAEINIKNRGFVHF